MPRLFRLLLLSLLTLFGTTVLARPTVGLVLGGGGARGAAHIGVLEVLEEMRVPVDCVAGTSMGALVAGAYASGLTPAMMREELAKTDWNDMFIDNPEYAELSYRNKTVSKRFLPGSETGIGIDTGVRYQGGVVSGQKIKLFFNRLVHSDLGERQIETLPMPLSIIATDIGTGERVVFQDGSLTKAMRASMSVPGLMAPVEDRNRKLVDGGLVDNLPIEEARNRCHPDVIIAVNVGSPLLKPEAIGSLLSVSAQMVNILTEQNVTRSLAQLREGDIYIKPELTGITSSDFHKNGETADLGRQAAEAQRTDLARLSVSEQEYAHWWQGIAIGRLVQPKIDEIDVVGTRVVNPVALKRYIEQQVGTPLDTDRLNRNLQRAYGDGYYQGIDYEVLSRRDRHILRVLPDEKPWGPDYLRVGLHLQSSLRRGSTYGVRAAYHRTWLNRLGGEAMITGEIGTTDALDFDWYQPVEESQTFFIEPQINYWRNDKDIFERDDKIAQLQFTEQRLAFMAGATLGRLGQIKAGWEEQRHHIAMEIGFTGLPPDDIHYGGWRVAIDLERKDRLYNATRGWSLRSKYFDSREAGYSKTDTELQGATAIGDYIFSGRARITSSPRGRVPYYDAPTLGGFLNLSGFSEGQIIGDDLRYGGVRIEKIVGRLPLGLRGDMRLGLALEVGKAGYRHTELTRAGNLKSGAIYLGGETPLGMLYLGYGRSNVGADNLYLFVGTP